MGVQIAAVSVDPVEDSRELAKNLGLTFPLLSDPGRQIIQAYGVDDPANEIAWPALFIINQQGVVAWRHIAKDYTKRLSVGAVLEVAQDVQAADASEPH